MFDVRSRRRRLVRAVGPAAAVITLVLTGLAADSPADDIAIQGSLSHESTPITQAQSRAKIHPSVNRALAAAPQQRVKAWVLFRAGKGVETAAEYEAAIDRLHQTYDARAIARRRVRRTRPGLFDVADLPVPKSYVDQVSATGASVHVVSRWVNGVSVRATQRQIETIAALPFVEKIQLVRKGKRIVPIEVKDVGRVAGTTGTTAGVFYGESEAQLTQINLIALHGKGFTGAGVRIGVLDTGFLRTHVAFNDPGHELSVVAEYDFVNDDPNTSVEAGDPPSQHSHGTLILGTLGAYKPTELVGAAYDAEFILCKTEDTTDEYPAEEDNYVAGLEFIEANGGDVATASLGYIDWYTQEDLDGLTAVTTIAVNMATANGVHCCNAAGNGGHDTDPATSHLIAPADAFDVITCGAAQADGTISGFSSDGPTEDGRVKPEVLALGSGTRTVSSSNDTDYVSASGTSLSTPLVAGAVACIVQAHPEWTVEQMRWYLLHTASDYVANTAFDPLFVRGYGVVDAHTASEEDCNTNGVADATDISLGATDCDGNGLLDVCEIIADPTLDADEDGRLDACGPAEIPTVSTWGLAILAVLLMTAATVLHGGRPRSAE